MCLNMYFATREEQQKVKPLVAKEDIVVFKVLKRSCSPISPRVTYWSPIRGFNYTPGYHYYQKGKHFGVERSSFHVTISEGLHAYTTKERANRQKLNSSYRVFKMIIPKGAKYYIGATNNDIVASEMIFPHQ